MMIEVSIGEIVDKHTILKIKAKKITDQIKLQNVNNELDTLSKSLDIINKEYSQSNIQKLYDELLKINNHLWGIEDELREKEKYSEFDSEFIKLARLVYILNDERARIKKQININCNSSIVEEKSYSSY